MAFNKKTHLRENIDAIRLALGLDKDNKQATPDEAVILTRYSGFGRIKAVLNPFGKENDRESGPNPTSNSSVGIRTTWDFAPIRRYLRIH